MLKAKKFSIFNKKQEFKKIFGCEIN